MVTFLHLFNQLFVIDCSVLCCSQEVFHHINKWAPGAFLQVIHRVDEISILYKFLNIGSIKHFGLQLFCVKSRNDLQMYFKQSPSLFRALTNCFMSPNLMCNGGKMILFLGTRASLIAFFHRPLTLEMATPSLCSANLLLYCPTYTKSRDVLCNHSVDRAENSSSSSRLIPSICDGGS